MGLSSPTPTVAKADELVRAVWGYAGLRAAQRRAVTALMHDRDCLAVLPTGAGKSLCYQVPALLLPGLTLVVSPLISLMQDQVTALRARGVAAAYLSSTQTPEVQGAVREATRAGRVRLLYVAPERLKTVPRILGDRSVSLLAVDEAHCISEWVHDFRPHYRRLGRLRAALGGPPTIALTATATPDTRADICTVLGLRRPVSVLTSFDRGNLYFAVRRMATEPARFTELTRLLRTVSRGSAIVYVPTKNRADGIAKVLRWHGFSAAPYHAGLPGPARRALLKRFLDAEIRVMVATTAFGMGIDKPDVRLVVHVGVPARPESYYQEAGRAGRDGQPARCVLLWRDHDLALAARLARGHPSPGSPASISHAQAARRGLETMRRYVTTRRCRRAVLLNYLGEPLTTCSGCDRCG
ncbi:MAG: ATP-dependent DNA helicase RecQ [Gemmatimonadetes bacterium]|nr:ATP-dependent DNA helicase RecQ [Gemmatimonadota bacterium]